MRKNIPARWGGGNTDTDLQKKKRQVEEMNLERLVPVALSEVLQSLDPLSLTGKNTVNV